MVKLSLIAFAMSSIVSFVPMEEAVTRQTHSSNGSLTISRCAAIISIMLWLCFMVWRYVTHREDFEGLDDDSNSIQSADQIGAVMMPDDSTPHGYQPRPQSEIETRPKAWRAWVYRSVEWILYIGLLAFLQDSLVVTLLGFSSQF